MGWILWEQVPRESWRERSGCQGPGQKLMSCNNILPAKQFRHWSQLRGNTVLWHGGSARLAKLLRLRNLPWRKLCNHGIYLWVQSLCVCYPKFWRCRLKIGDVLDWMGNLNWNVSTLDFRQNFERFYRLPLTPMKTDCNLRCEHENETLCDIYLVWNEMKRDYILVSAFCLLKGTISSDYHYDVHKAKIIMFRLYLLASPGTGSPPGT